MQLYYAILQGFMNWEALKVFVTIARTGSLSGAAKELRVNHSTVFRKLQALEKDIGARLLEKIDNKYVLTLVGEEILTEANRISDSFDLIERRIVGTDFKPRGIVKITAPSNIVNLYLSSLLADFCIEYPEIEINLLSSNFDLNLNNRQADIAVRATPSPPEHLIGRKLCKIPWSLFASSAYIKKHGQPTALCQLPHHRLIGATGAMLNLPGFMWLESQYPESITSRCDDLTGMAYLAKHSHGVAFLPHDQARDGIDNILGFEPGKTSDLWLLTHPDLRKVERIKLVMKYLTEAFKLVF